MRRSLVLMICFWFVFHIAVFWPEQVSKEVNPYIFIMFCLWQIVGAIEDLRLAIESVKEPASPKGETHGQ